MKKHSIVLTAEQRRDLEGVRVRFLQRGEEEDRIGPKA